MALTLCSFDDLFKKKKANENWYFDGYTKYISNDNITKTDTTCKHAKKCNERISLHFIDKGIFETLVTSQLSIPELSTDQVQVDIIFACF